ncbi:HAMP domain-containing sensor histidine kinase [Spirosoma harenae]
MTFCILGINAFQVYWLWNTYQLNRQQFNQTVQDAFFKVLEQQQVAQASRLLGKKQLDSPNGPSQMIIRDYNGLGSSALNHEQTHVIIRTRSDSSLSDISADRSVKGRTITYNVKLAEKQSDTLARRISALVLLDWTKGKGVDLHKLKAAYHTELLRRGVDTDFRLDTIHIRPQQTAKNRLVFQSQSSTNERNSPDTVYTAPVLLNPVRDLFAQASFATPTFYLLQRMGWLLGSSVFLLLLTTGCFLFMLSTILRQKKLSDVKNDFINNMTHELKTPIATVTAAVEAMQHFGVLDDPKKTQTYLTISRNNLQRLSDLVEKVLNLAVEEKRELALQPESVHLLELVNGLIANHQLQSSKSVSFSIDIPANAVVQVDRVHFSNALNNLIDNAIKYSNEEVRVRVQFGQTDTSWQLSVQDNGIGIPKTYQSAIFDRFFRVPTGNLHPVKGFGLGLAYVRQVIERHGGRISVQSEPGQGSEFLLSF